jgi:hypothetical protein
MYAERMAVNGSLEKKRTQTMRKKTLRTAAKRRRKAYAHPSPWRRRKCGGKAVFRNK